MRTACVSITVLLAVALAVPAVFGQDGAAKAATFDSADAIAGWTTSGDVSVDASKNRDGEGGGALKIGPRGKAVWTLRNADGSGKVDLWVFDDQTKPADAKASRVGPRWGLIQDDGRVLVMGILYARYLSGGTTYAASDSDQRSWFKVQYSAVKRTAGWHRWTFDFDAAKGLTIAHNGKALPKRRFDWNKTEIKGFTGLALFGDAGKGNEQTLWVDDVAVELGGPMKNKPAPPPPPPPATPETDPAPDKPVSLVAAVEGKHPRLLFTAQDIPAMKAKIKVGYGKSLYDRMVAYVPVSRKPDRANFLKDATDGQRQGFWRLPTVALHYVLTGDKRSFDRTVEFMKFLMELDHWETGKEQDSGMSSSNVMVGAALAYDWLYNDLDPAFRSQYRDKLLLMARRQYYRGHLNRAKSVGYWQGDPQNNHRFHRNAGMTLAVLAAAEADKADDDWILAKTLEELKYVLKWLPEDGTSHESPTYAVFGNTHLMLAIDAAQRCYGVPLMDHPFFKNCPAYKIQTMRPDLKEVFGYGDSGGGGSGYHNFLNRMTAYHRLADEQAAIIEMDRRNKTFYSFAWFSVIWWQPLEGGSMDNLPRHAFFPDLGLSYFRTGWQADDVGAMFKCGPFGGYKLNEYRHRNAMKYVNVAHDDPDANSFQVFTGGEMVAETDRYSKHKRSANYNTILVGGAGQVVAGRPEGGGWSQPGGNMSEMAVVTARAHKGNHVAVEGEAAGSYLANPRKGPKRPALDRFRRTFIWVEGKYLLVLDDIRAPQAVDVAWLMQSGKVQTADAAAHRYVLTKGKASCPFQVAATEAVASEVVDSPADGRGKPLGWKQLRLKANTAAIRLASVYDPWHKGHLTVTLAADGADHATVTVSGADINDTWDWTCGKGRLGPSTVVGKTSGGQEILTLSEPEPETRKLIEIIRAAD